MCLPSSLLFMTFLCVTPVCLTGCDFGDGDTEEPDATPDGGSQDDPFARAIVSAHNSVRLGATPAPNPPLPLLSWSTEAAAVAQAWADKCEYGHNPKRGNHGENIAASTPGHWMPATVVQDWAAEASFYDYGKNTCAPGELCGHYTQIVWRSTTQVGCAKKVCTKNSPFSGSPQWDFWVCNYAPPGNYAGQRPY